MENTYTYTARSAENPEQIITFTLRKHYLEIAPGGALEKIEQAIAGATDEETAGPAHHLWLKPAAINLLERGTSPFRVQDVHARVDGDRLSLSAWLRPGGLRLAPVPLMHGRVDNADAAQAFVAEVEKRQEEAGMTSPLFAWMDYWATWAIVGVGFFLLLEGWRHRQREQ